MSARELLTENHTNQVSEITQWIPEVLAAPQAETAAQLTIGQAKVSGIEDSQGYQH